MEAEILEWAFNASLFRIEFRFCGMNEMDSVLDR